MLTICIPVFNYDVGNLVADLEQQAAENKIEAEIILIDDNSEQGYKELNQKINSEKVRFIALEKNIGRAAIRNLFCKYARFDNLLFLDCDSGIIHSSFLKNYMAKIRNRNEVICGGRIYSAKKPARNKLLHWKYGKKKESKPATTREENPYDSFMTNNFLIKKNVLKMVHFEEKLSDYGHEDTLFGYDLMKKNIPIEHIDNPVIHDRLDTNAEFLEKTKKGVSNLIKILPLRGYDEEFIQHVTLLRTFYKLKKNDLDKLVFFFSVPVTKLATLLLKRGIINLKMFSLMKLSVFVNLYRGQTKQVR